MKLADNKLRLYVNCGAWFLALLVSALAFIAWGQTYEWQLSKLSIYQIFPLLGLLAFSLMWTHYVVSIVRQRFNLPFEAVKLNFEITSWIVLALICLHPGLLIYKRFQDGYGLPPGSYLSYVIPSVRWVTLLGSVSLLLFLAYELRRIFSQRPWWRYMQIAVDIAMVAIFYHGLRLGSQLNSGGWYRIVWLLYGFVLVDILIYTYILKPSQTPKSKPVLSPSKRSTDKH